jgi:hypothetical protein
VARADADRRAIKAEAELAVLQEECSTLRAKLRARALPHLERAINFISFSMRADMLQQQRANPL